MDDVVAARTTSPLTNYELLVVVEVEVLLLPSSFGGENGGVVGGGEGVKAVTSMDYSGYCSL